MGPRLVTQLLAAATPGRVMRRRERAGAQACQHLGPRQRAGLAGHDLEVVVQINDWPDPA